MRKTLTALFIAAALPTFAFAGAPSDVDAPPPPPGKFFQGHGPRDDRGGPFRELDLTKEQREQVGKLFGESMKNRHEITEKYLNKLSAADRKAMQDEFKASHDKTDSAIRGLLTPEQQKKFDQLKKEREQRKAEWAEFQQWKAQKDGKTTH